MGTSPGGWPIWCGVYRPLPTVTVALDHEQVDDKRRIRVDRVELDGEFIGWTVEHVTRTGPRRHSIAVHAPTTVRLAFAATRTEGAGLLVAHAERRAKEKAA